MKHLWKVWSSAVRRMIPWRTESLVMNQRPQYQGYVIGDWSYGNPDILKWNDQTKLTIGKFCSLAKGVRIVLGGEHHSEWISTYPLDIFVLGQDAAVARQPSTKGDVVIGNDVWIGVNSVILSGVTIGDGAIIGAASLVTRDIPPYTIAAGHPAKPLRKRFEEPVIQALLTIRWWDWPLEKIKEAQPLLMSDNLDAFFKRYAPGGVVSARPELR